MQQKIIFIWTSAIVYMCNIALWVSPSRQQPKFCRRLPVSIFFFSVILFFLLSVGFSLCLLNVLISYQCQNLAVVDKTVVDD